MAGHRFPRLGWTLDRWREPPKYDYHNVRPYGPRGALLTESPVGILVILAMLIVLVGRVPETLAFFLPSALVGALIGLILWLRHR